MIRLIDVYKEYDNGTKALKGVNMRIDDGEFVFLVGPSGSGKSTIIKLITGEIAATEGKLMVNGYSLNNIAPRQIPYMRRTLGIIFQDFRLIEKKTVYENLSFAMRAIHCRFQPGPEAAHSLCAAAGGTGAEGGPVSWTAVRRRAAACGYCPGAGE